MPLPAIMLGIAAIGGLTNAIAGFFGASKMKKAAQANYENEIENIGQSGERGLDELKKFRKQGDAFVGTQNVNAATSGVTGSSTNLATTTSRVNLEADAIRQKKQLMYNINSAKRQAEINRDAKLVQGTTMGMQAAGTLLTTSADIYGTGRTWGVYG
jgi:hypothetical protein